jgi:hypothetical protein
LKEITNISSEGITYLDEEGNSQFFDFETCSQNYVMRMEKIRGSGFTDEDRAFWRKGKFVGVRLTFRQAPAIEFYTEPRIYFEFPTSDDVWKVASRIKEAGWRSSDGE